MFNLSLLILINSPYPFVVKFFIHPAAATASRTVKFPPTFTVPGLGKLVLVDRKARQGRKPQTGEVIQIPAKKVVKFRIAKACKDSIL